jgi:hypothetical protein
LNQFTTVALVLPDGSHTVTLHVRGRPTRRLRLVWNAGAARMATRRALGFVRWTDRVGQTHRLLLPPPPPN